MKSRSSQSLPRALPDPRAPPDPSQEFPESLLGWAATEGSRLFLGGPMEGQMLSSIVNKKDSELFGTRRAILSIPPIPGKRSTARCWAPTSIKPTGKILKKKMPDTYVIFYRKLIARWRDLGLVLEGPMEGQILSSIRNNCSLELFGTRRTIPSIPQCPRNDPALSPSSYIPRHL